jgi:protease secretion system membrane fusion protein
LSLAVLFGGFLLWASFAPLDEGVPAEGMVSIDTKRKPVQHLSGGIVKEVLVHEGSVVKEGQVVMRLNEQSTRASYEQSRQRYLGLRAVQGRLLAEQAGLAAISFHPELLAEAGDPLIKHQITTQEQLFTARRTGLKAELQAIQENIRGQEASIQAYRSILVQRRSQSASLNEELNNTRGLVQDGYAPRNRQLELERLVADTTGSVAEITGNIARGQQTIAEARQRLIALQQEYRKEIETQLTDVTRDAEAEGQRYKALAEDLKRVEIKAPATGQVVSLAAQTVGAVISPGQKLMDIVPEKEKLLLEARVPPHLIDRVREGMPVDMWFNAFAHTPDLVVDGKLVSLSRDLLQDPQNANTYYYLARIEVTPEGMKKLGHRVIQPGMPAQFVIKTGERSLLTYIMYPLVRRIAASMKEE